MRFTALAASLSVLVAAAQGAATPARVEARGDPPVPTGEAAGEQNCYFYWFAKGIKNFLVKVGKDEVYTTTAGEYWLFDCGTTATATRNIYNKAYYIKLKKDKNGKFAPDGGNSTAFTEDWRNGYYPSYLFRSVDEVPADFDKRASPNVQ